MYPIRIVYFSNVRVQVVAPVVSDPEKNALDLYTVIN